MLKLLVASNRFRGVGSHVGDFTFEIQAVVDRATSLDIDVLTCDPRQLVFEFRRGDECRATLEGREIDSVSALLVRGTTGAERATKLLASVLNQSGGCYLVDPLERFDGARAGKAFDTVSLHSRKVGSDSFLVFGISNGVELVRQLWAQARFPLVLKPFDGRQGKGIQWVHTCEEAEQALTGFAETRGDADEPVLIQPDEHFSAEWRVMVLDGRSLGCARKQQNVPGRPANAAQGATFVEDRQDDVVEFALHRGIPRGLLGVDVARALDGSLRIIEENYAPQWETFQLATGVDVADVLVKHIVDKVAQPRRRA